MRLRTCVTLELLAAAVIASSTTVGGVIALRQLRASLESEAVAAARGASAAGDASEFAAAEDGDFESIAGVGLFNGVSDEVLLQPLRTGVPAAVKFNRGGSSISLRIDFDNGARAAFKPRQTNLHTIPRREVAAFRVNRMLGMAAVPPAFGRRLAVRDLLAKLRPDSRVFIPRLKEEMLPDARRGLDGEQMIVGELSFWIPVIRVATVGPYAVDSMDGVVTWQRYLKAGAAIPHDDRRIISQIANLVVFDFVIDNADRWSGGNVRMSADARVLYFMDNTLSFGLGKRGRGKPLAYLVKVEKFSQSLVASLQSLRIEDVRAELTRDLGAFDFLLTDDEIEAVLARRDFVLDYIADLISTHGREAVMVFP